ncbi:hypothetical protein COOONC_14836 [Cooperia oncophora]
MICSKDDCGRVLGQPSVQEAHLSSEMQLAVNYMLLSACFLVMTTFFNLKIIDQVDQIPRGKVTSGHRAYQL